MDLNKEITTKIKSEKIYRVVFYGPSTVNMQHVFPAWPEIIRYALREHFEKLTGGWKLTDWYIQTANRSLDGATSEELLNNSEEFVVKENADLVILSVSKNDAYFNIAPDKTEMNTKKLIDNLLENNIKIIFTTSVISSDEKINARIYPYVEADKKVAEFYRSNNNFKFIDFFKLTPGKLLDKMYTFISEGNDVLGFKPGDIDTIHFNRYGNAAVAGIILKECFGLDFDADKFLTDLKDDTIMHPRF